MEPLTIRVYPDSILRKKCPDVEVISHTEKELFKRMLFTMRRLNAVGLAAPQIGIARKMIVADIGKGAVQLANPCLIKTEGSAAQKEGCLSIPGIDVEVTRAGSVVVRGLDAKGRDVEVAAEGLMARVLQHEIDHLDGKLIIDYGSIASRMMLFVLRRRKNRSNIGKCP